MRAVDSLQVGSINLTDSAVQKWVLQHDKQTRLEGLCVEYVFRRLFIKPHFVDDNISADWWFKAKGSSFLPVKLMRRLKLNAVDCKLFDTFVQNGVEPAFIYYQASHQRFLVGSGKNVLNNGNLDLGCLRPVKKQEHASPTIKNGAERQLRAIRFLRRRKLVQDAAVQRYVANWILAGRKLWDLDCFVMHGNEIIVFEVKQKFPTKAGTFGLNLGLKKLFEWLEQINIKVYHLVLTKPVWQEDFPALEFLENKLFWEHEIWLAIRPLVIQEASAMTGVAPAKTSIHGTGKLLYYHIPISAFSILGSFIDAHRTMSELLAGKSLKTASLSAIPRLNKKAAIALCTTNRTFSQMKLWEVEAPTWDFCGADTKELSHCFHNYPAMMIPQVARRLIQNYGPPSRTGILLDPFCGSGTSLVEAKVYGLNAYGIDINPLARLLARVKTTPLSVSELRHGLKVILQAYNTQKEEVSVSVPNFFNIEYWFSEQTILQLQILADAIGHLEGEKLRDFFLVPFSETVREASYTRNSEFKLYRIPKERLSEHKANVKNIFSDKAQRNIQGMRDFNRVQKTKCWTRVLDEDTRTQTSIPQASVDLVVTSPPYGDSKTTVAYGQFSRLSLQWLGYDRQASSSIDKLALGGRVTKWHRADKLSETLEQTLEKVAQSSERRADEVLSFYIDFDRCLVEIARVVKPGGYICMVVGNRTVTGQKIPTDKIFIEMCSRHEMTHVKTFYRNIPNKRMPSRNSPSNVAGETSPTILKESIIIFKKRKCATVGP